MKAYAFPSDKTVITLGRDLNNYISIGDSGISRTHGRFEWDTRELMYVDVGSSFGSKLNGDIVHRSRVNVGDHIQVGRSVISLRPRDWVGEEEGREDCMGSSSLEAQNRTKSDLDDTSKCIIS